MSLRELVEGYVYHEHRKTFPVVSDGTLVGYVETDALARFPRSEWEFRTVGEVMHNDPAPVAIRSDADALDALKRMQQTGSGRLFADDGRLVGILSLKDLLRFLTLKLEVEHATEGGAAAAAG